MRFRDQVESLGQKAGHLFQQLRRKAGVGAAELNSVLGSCGHLQGMTSVLSVM